MSARTRRRLGRVAALASVTFAGLTCRDRSPLGPGIPVEARYELAPRFAVARSGPVLTLDAVRATLVPFPTGEGAPVLDTVARFAAGGAELQLDLALRIVDPNQRYVLRLAATDAAGDTIYRAVDTVKLVVTGDGRPPAPVPMALFYSGPDTAVVAMSVAPRDSLLAVGDSVQVRAVGRRADSSVVAGVRFGYAVSDSAAASISPAGVLKANAAFTDVWVYAGTANGRIDSTRVSAYVAVASVVASPDTLSLVIGETGVVAAEARDADGARNPDAALAWTVLDTVVAKLASTAATGATLQALGAGETRAVVAAGAFADTVVVLVRASVTELRVTPRADTLFIRALDDTLQLAAQAYQDSLPVSTQVEWLSHTPEIAGVDTAGIVYGHASGWTWIVAHEPQSGRRDSVLVVVRQEVASVVVEPDTVRLVAFGERRTFGAVAYDARGNVVQGIAFTWATSSAATVALDSVTTTSAQGVANGNGTAQVRAMAGTISGGATVTVAQQLASLVASPVRYEIGAGQSIVLAVEALDPNGYPLRTPVPIDWTSDAPDVASVVGATGLVTGHATGTAKMTARSGGILSNAVVVDVTALRISLEADTIAVGSRTLTSIVVRLVGTAPTDVVVNLAVRDTSVARLSTTYGQVHFPRGATTRLVDVVGGQLGTTQLVATQADPGSCDGPCGNMDAPTFAGDTAAVTVVAGMQLETAGELALGDSSLAQLALQTPAPAGGLTVTFTYDVPGVARVLPETLTVPAGHLAHDVTVHTLAEGVVRITPVPVTQPAPPGLATALRVGPPSLQLFGNDTLGTAAVIGAGQEDDVVFAWLRTPPSAAVTLAVGTGTGTAGVAGVPSGITVDPRTSGSPVHVVGRGVGTDEVVVSGALYGTARLPLHVTTPFVVATLGDAADTLLTTMGEPRSLDIAVGDSLRQPHQRAADLELAVTSTDSGVVRVVNAVALIARGETYTYGATVEGVGAGEAMIVVAAPGHRPDTIAMRVVLPKLRLGLAGDYEDTARVARLHANEMPAPDARLAVIRPDYTSQPTEVRLTHSNPAAATSDATVTIGAWATLAEIASVRGVAAGIDTLVAEAAGHLPDTLVLEVLPARLAITDSRDSLQLGELAYVTVGTASGGSVVEPVTAAVRSSDRAVLDVDTAVVIGAGQQGAGGVPLRAVGLGTATLTVSAPGYGDTTHTVVVRGGKLLASADFHPYGRGDTARVGVGQRAAAGGAGHLHVALPKGLDKDVVVTVRALEEGLLDLPVTVVLGASNSWEAALAPRGLKEGTARVVFEAETPGFEPDTLVVEVAAPAIVQASPFLPPRARAGESATVRFELTDAPSAPIAAWYGSAYAHDAADTLVLRVTSSDPKVAQVETEWLRVPAGTASAPPVAVHYVGGGTATITVADSLGAYVPFVQDVTVDGYALTWNRYGSLGDRASLGVRQRFGQSDVPSVCTNGATVDSVHVVITSSESRVAKPAADTVSIAPSSYAWGNCATVDMLAGDTLGTVAVTARSADGRYAPDTLRLTVGRPRLVVTSAPDTLWVGMPATELTFQVADHLGNPRENLDTLAFTATASRETVVSLATPVPVTLLPGEATVRIAVSPLDVGESGVTVADLQATGARSHGAVTTPVITVARPQLAILSSGALPTARQHNTWWRATLPFAPGTATWAQLASSDTAAARLSADSVDVTWGEGYFDVAGGAVGGVATITGTTAVADAAQATLTFRRGRLSISGAGGELPQGTGVWVTVTAMDAGGWYEQNVTVDQRIALELPAGLTASDGQSPVTAVTIPAGASSVSFQVMGAEPGSWTFVMSNPDFELARSAVITVVPQAQVQAAAAK